MLLLLLLIIAAASESAAVVRHHTKRTNRAHRIKWIYHHRRVIITQWRARQKKLAGYAARSRAGRHQAAAGRGVGARQPPAGAARAGLQDNFIGRRATYMYRESRGGRATRESRIEHWDREMYHYHSVLRRAFHQCRSSAPDRTRDKMENRCVR
eukprot:COSAG06_NODE_147_length_22091_cov_70.669880_20_plen_154_part_00